MYVWCTRVVCIQRWSAIRSWTRACFLGDIKPALLQRRFLMPRTYLRLHHHHHHCGHHHHRHHRQHHHWPMHCNESVHQAEISKSVDIDSDKWNRFTPEESENLFWNAASLNWSFFCTHHNNKYFTFWIVTSVSATLGKALIYCRTATQEESTRP